MCLDIQTDRPKCITLFVTLAPREECVLTTGPSPHLRGYVSRSMMTLLILATMPWSHVARTAVVIWAMAASCTHDCIELLSNNCTKIIKFKIQYFNSNCNRLISWTDDTNDTSDSEDGSTREKNKTKAKIDGLCQPRHESYRDNRRWIRWQNWPEENCLPQRPHNSVEEEYVVIREERSRSSKEKR